MKVEKKFQGTGFWYEVSGLELSEPIAVFRGRDPLALQVIMDYEQKMEQLGILTAKKRMLLQDLAKDFVKYGATAQLRFPD